jgi:hypothetical protein
MPRTFTVDSGLDLSEPKKLHAELISEWLQSHALFVKSNPTHPTKIVKNKVLADKFQRIFGIKYPDSTIRAMINYLRQKDIPICANNEGYWFALTSKELEDPIMSLIDREHAIVAARAGLQRAHMALKIKESGTMQGVMFGETT